ncbi:MULTISPECIES: glutathione S-transferase family protein [Halomonadaceae]|uniref:Glutathione S-transferase n=1 Tax=Vreelandella halophila TaxID=86177 RepID=A0A9X4YE39_9GAMM|nr:MULTISPECIES: glutathione S-transferase family protein [Halomonas]MYL27796.1 glutathione S-transferase [Halomonas utahensis]MYL74922.1 glutathione S-transferase [Halomonas sp. 22501_18_FS]
MTTTYAFTHYGTGFSLYSGKTRSYLRYKGIPFEERLATLSVYRRVLIPKTGVSMIPVLETPEHDFIQDTVEIIDTLEARFPERGIYPSTPKQRLVSLLVELYADEWLLIPAMHFRWSFPEENRRFIHGEFGKIVSPWLPGPLRRLAGSRLAKRFSGMLPMLGITEKTSSAIENWYYSVLDQLDAHFAQHPYLLGERASIGDFGLMAPLYAHLYRDPAPGRIMKRRAPHLVEWIERMNTRKPRVGDWLTDDQIPETLYPLLKHQFGSQFPVLRETVDAVAKWIDEHPGKKVPRKLGVHQYHLSGVDETRALMSFPQWKLQRPLDFYQGLAEDQRGPVDELLDEVGGREAMNMTIPRRVRRENNRLVPDD